MALVAKNTTTGAVIADAVAVADTRATRAVGLLSRSGLEPGEGLWIVPSRGVHTCGMRFSIDVIALDEALTDLGALDERLSRVVELRFAKKCVRFSSVMRLRPTSRR